jgi:hypothetical protein
MRPTLEDLDDMQGIELHTIPVLLVFLVMGFLDAVGHEITSSETSHLKEG